MANAGAGSGAGQPNISEDQALIIAQEAGLPLNLAIQAVANAQAVQAAVQAPEPEPEPEPEPNTADWGKTAPAALVSLVGWPGF